MTEPIENPNQSLQETARRLHACESSIEDTLEWMAQNGHSVSLRCTVDDAVWRCCWVTGEKLYVGHQDSQRMAILQSLNLCFADVVQIPRKGGTA